MKFTQDELALLSRSVKEYTSTIKSISQLGDGEIGKLMTNLKIEKLAKLNDLEKKIQEGID